MKTILVTRTETVMVEDDKRCSEKCLHYGPHNGPKCCLFEETIRLDEETGDPRRVHECRNGEEKRKQATKIEDLANTAGELTTLLKDVCEYADELETGLDELDE